MDGQIERKDAFRRLNETVKRGLSGFFEAGKALIEIRDNELFREGGYGTLKDYMESEIETGWRQGYNLLKAAEIKQEHDVPSLRAALKLSDVPEDQRSEVLAIASERQGGIEKVTAPMIQDVHEELRPKPTTFEPPDKSEFQALVFEVKQIGKRLNSLHSGPGRHLYINEAQGHIKSLAALINKSIPTVPCPECFGRQSQCHLCEGIGWVTQELFDARGEQYR
tara:strand:- start:11228 stop:11896 length:669 start_codon:yes stop_codon:yes gene_type:complete